MNNVLPAIRRSVLQRPPLRTLRSKFILGFIIAFAIAIGNILIVKSLLAQSETIAATVNVAGKMRMLGQRIGFMLLVTEQLDVYNNNVSDSQPQPDFQAYKIDFQHALNVLRYGGTAFDLDVPAVTGDAQRHLDSIEQAWATYLNALAKIERGVVVPGFAVGALTQKSHAEAVVELIASNEWLLINSENLIDSLVQQSKTMQQQVMQKVYGLFGINLLMLVLAGAIIFLKVLRPIQRLMVLSDQLVAGNYSVRLCVQSDDEFGALGDTLNNSAFHIEQLLQNIELKEKALEQAEVTLRRAALVYEHITEAVVVTDVEACAQAVNPAFTTITGYSPSEVIGQRMDILSTGPHADHFFQELRREIIDTGSWRGDIQYRRKCGEEFIAHLIITTYFNDDGSVNCRIGLFSDVTEKRQQEALVWRQSRFDHLTRLPNRQMFHENLQLSMDQSRRSGLPFAVIFLDLDWFKEVNDTFGHEEGDVLLSQVAQRLSDCCRKSDQVARLGGDEFIMIIQDLQQLDNVRPICKKVLEAVARPYTLGVGEIRISCSVGVAFYPNDTDDPMDLLKYADLAMYAAKDKGRNQYCLFSMSMHDALMRRQGLLRDLQWALDSKQFVLHYQPIVDLQTGLVSRAEALVRWDHPRRGMVSPGDFIPLAEDSGMIVALGDHVFSQAIRQVALWRHELHRDFSVSVNVSPNQFENGGLDPADWARQLQELDLPGSAVAIEITERLLITSKSDVCEKLQAFRKAGIRIALDDFGTGHSSVSYLRRFNIDLIKIDQSFVCNLTESSENMVLCKAIITMAHQLGMKVVAEGIETAQQHELLQSAGCDYGQGYWYSRPVSADDFAVWVKDNN